MYYDEDFLEEELPLSEAQLACCASVGACFWEESIPFPEEGSIRTELDASCSDGRAGDSHGRSARRCRKYDSLEFNPKNGGRKISKNGGND